MAKRKTAAERRAVADAARSEAIKQTFARLDEIKEQLEELGRIIEAVERTRTKPH